ncbi:DMT family transporter [Rhodovulum sp. 12E13]|uniref:DMT family transporter n=1 Tax=Rhodovulum sp. 12E13 TaxID=2203891 RepID=UPI000E18808E|nr:DMT family transporter [Rhodovulum sp. 12E13]RDC72538.1 DMT family transporter [Rhodovulum sp. 12E13]
MDDASAPRSALPAVSMPLATALVVLASVGFGSVPFFARGLTEAGMAPHAVALWRYALAALIFLPVVVGARAQWRLLLAGAAVGLGIGLGWVAYVRALTALPVATVGVVYMTFPVFALLASRLLFGERPSARGLAAAGVVTAAAALAAGPAALHPASAGMIALAFLSPATFGAAIACLVHLLPPLPVLARMGAISLGSVAGLLPLVAATPVERIVPADGHALALVVGISLGTALLPQLLYTFFAPVVGAARAATAGAAELPTMLAIGWLAMGEAITLPQAVAAGLIVGAIALSPSRRLRGPVVTAATTPRRRARP